MKNKSWWFTIATVMVLIGLISAGCTTPTEAPTGEAPVTQPAEEVVTEEPVPTSVPEKTQITIVIAEDPPTFNGAVNQSGFDILVMELTMLGLADVDEVGNAFPELALELPTVDNGGVVIDEENGVMDVTWKMRQDIMWEDGTPVSADDVVFTYEAVVDPETGYWIPGIDYVDSVEKVDDYTVVVHYNAIYPGYLPNSEAT